MEKEKLFEMAGEVYRNVPAYVNYLLDKSVDINDMPYLFVKSSVALNLS